MEGGVTQGIIHVDTVFSEFGTAIPTSFHYLILLLFFYCRYMHECVTIQLATACCKSHTHGYLMQA